MDQETIEGMRRLQAGDTQALGALYDRYAPLLHAVALRIVRSAADAEDVLQQAWMQVWRSAKRFDARRGTIASWLLTIVRSRALDRVRAHASRDRAERDVPQARTDASGDPARRLDERQRHLRVRQALDSLDPGHRAALELGYFDGLTQSEIAERLGAPLGTVKTWTRRGLLRLKELLAGEAQP